MEKILIYLFFLISFLFLLRMKWAFIFFLPVFNILADMSFSFFPGFSAPTLLRAGINFVFLFYVGKEVNSVRLKSWFYMFFAAILILLMFSETFIYSLKVAVQVIMSMTMFLAGYAVFRKVEGIDYLIDKLKPVIFLAVIATAVGYLFDVGQNLQYTTSSKYTAEAENVGLLGSGGMYSPGIVLGMLPLLIRLQRRRFDLILLIMASALLYLFILLNVRRTAIIIPILGLLGFFLYMPFRARTRILQYVVIIALGLMVAYPLYSDILNRRFEFRQSQGRFEKDFYKTEARYLETVNMFNEISVMNEPLKVLLGIGNNLFADQYENGVAVKRMIHSDIPKIYFSMGLFGVILYIIIYLIILREILKIPSSGRFRDLKAACLGLFFISVFVSINGSITLFSFRSLNFLLLGAIIGYSRKLMHSYGELSSDKSKITSM